MLALVERQYLHGDVTRLGGVEQPLELRPHHGVAATTPRHPLGKTIWAEISTAGSGSQLT
ncbi:hypothetical protein GCM10010350_31990 [Streptomyces galilaeus]|nr:hypothetical protein GCM10010350_31990 [Streptomyces galilaeus]